MSPSEVYEMDDDTYQAFAAYMREEIREVRKARNRKRR